MVWVFGDRKLPCIHVDGSERAPENGEPQNAYVFVYFC